MVELLRHRQTKGAATDMVDLKPPAPHSDSTPSVLSERFATADAFSYRDPDSRLVLAIRDIVEGLRRWELWVTLGWHDIRQRYRRSLIGPFWLTLSMGILVGTLGFLYSGLFGQPIREYLPRLA